MTKVTIEIDVPEEYADDLKSEVRNAVRAIRNRYICPSTYGGDACVLDAGHDGPTCTDGVREWPCPFGNDVPASGQRVFETGRKVRHRTTGTLYVMGSVAGGTVQLKDGPSSTYEPAATSFWAKYYAIAGRPAEPTVTITETDNNHLTGWAPGNLQHHLIFDHGVSPADVPYDGPLDEIHRKRHP